MQRDGDHGVVLPSTPEPRVCVTAPGWKRPGGADDVEDAHLPAALAADSHVDGEHSSEQVGPAETARAGGGLGGVAVVRGEVEVELLPGRGDSIRWEDASAKMVSSGM